MTVAATRANATDDALRIIIPKKGRLCTAFAAAMEKGELRVEKKSPRHDFGTLKDSQNTLQNVEALTMRSTDALRTMAAGAADMAVVGLDMLREFNAQNPALLEARVERLGLTPCALYIAVPEKSGVAMPQDLNGTRIATSFPGVLAAWLAENDVEGVDIVPCEGGVEDMVRLGLADAVCDLVETGGTLAANGLEKRMKVMDSEAVLVIAPRAGYQQASERTASAVCAAAARMVPAYA
jgi:ATP phosphoribosyltransferase